MSCSGGHGFPRHTGFGGNARFSRAPRLGVGPARNDAGGNRERLRDFMAGEPAPVHRKACFRARDAVRPRGDGHCRSRRWRVRAAPVEGANLPPPALGFSRIFGGCGAGWAFSVPCVAVSGHTRDGVKTGRRGEEDARCNCCSCTRHRVGLPRSRSFAALGTTPSPLILPLPGRLLLAGPWWCSTVRVRKLMRFRRFGR